MRARSNGEAWPCRAASNSCSKSVFREHAAHARSCGGRPGVLGAASLLLERAAATRAPRRRGRRAAVPRSGRAPTRSPPARAGRAPRRASTSSSKTGERSARPAEPELEEAQRRERVDANRARAEPAGQLEGTLNVVTAVLLARRRRLHPGQRREAERENASLPRLLGDLNRLERRSHTRPESGRLGTRAPTGRPAGTASARGSPTSEPPAAPARRDDVPRRTRRARSTPDRWSRASSTESAVGGPGCSRPGPDQLQQRRPGDARLAREGHRPQQLWFRVDAPLRERRAHGGRSPGFRRRLPPSRGRSQRSSGSPPPGPGRRLPPRSLRRRAARSATATSPDHISITPS